MPRASPKRLSLFLICLISSVLLIINICVTLNGYDADTMDKAEEAGSMNSRKPTENLSEIVKSDLSDTRTTKKVSKHKPVIKMFPSRPWYLSGGAVRPDHVLMNRTSHVLMNRTSPRTSHLFPEESPGQDRITEQLMFLPPAGEIPSNQEDARVTLKKILIWNTASSWGGGRPGGGVNQAGVRGGHVCHHQW